MKKIKGLLIFCVIATAVSSCQDGDLGVSKFIIENASGAASNFYTTDPNIPYPCVFYENYTTTDGIYTCVYDHGFFTYGLTYEIVQEDGDSWNGVTDGFLTQPSSGKNRQYVFDCDAVNGYELSYRTNITEPHPDIIIDKTFYFNGGKMIVKGKGVYNPKHIHQNVTSK